MGDPFVTPLVYVNPAGFGPTTLPERFTNVPYVTYTKWEKLGKAANFGGFQLGQNQRQFERRDNRFDDKKVLFGGSIPQTVAVAPIDDDFELVDTATRNDSNKNRGPRWNVKRGGQGGFRGGRGRGGRGGMQRDAIGTRGEPLQDPNQPALKGKQAKFLLQGARRGKQWSKRGGGPMGRRRDMDRDVLKEASVKVKANWDVVEQLDLPQFSKMIAAVPTAEDVLCCGELHKFDETYDRLSVRSSKPLKLTAETSFVYAGTLEDPVIEKLIAEKKGTVFATDEILSYLMTAPRSVKTWDLVFTRIGDVLFIDKRDDAGLEVLTVNETFTDRISEKDEARLKMPYNSQEKLALEGTAIHQSFLCQVLKRDEVTAQPNPNPFAPEKDSGETPRQPITYCYRTWQLGAHKLVARTEIHAAVPNKSAPSQPDRKVNVYSLNEYDSKLTGNVEWRQKLDNQKGAVMANELKNNAAKLARWTAQSLMAGVDSMKIGFISRMTPTDPTKHLILGVNTVKPRDLAMQINLSEKNMWGIVKTVVDMIMSKEPGKYLLVRDPNKPVVRLYKVPMSTFEESEDEGEDESEEEEDEEGGEVFRQPEEEEEEDDQ
jgi:translation initiation factor 3 subunit D